MTERTFFITTPEWKQSKASKFPVYLEATANFPQQSTQQSTCQSTQQSQLTSGMTIITGSDAHHLINVLRKQKGDLVHCVDDGGCYYRGKIVSIVKRGGLSATDRSKMSPKYNSSAHKSIEVNKSNNRHGLAVNVWLTKVAERVVNKVILPQITVILSMPHPRTLAAVTGKLSECGVKALQIIITERSFIKDVKAINMGRLQRIASEAQKHSGRLQPMEIRPPLKLNTLLADKFYIEQFKALHVKNVLFWEHEPYDCTDCDEEGRSIAASSYQVRTDRLLAGKDKKNKTIENKTIENKTIENKTIENKTINIVIGPEGGITREECDLFKAAGMEIASLHPYILKVETAVLLAIARYF
ncbi:hypothetical protein COTS27_01305 [Spirochaetota bacterium]|nr:hypothetical protein COTS27_01305 [Spirochaetota bacterium]